MKALEFILCMGLGVSFILAAIIEFANVCTYGWFLSDAFVYDGLVKNKDSIHVNQFNPSIFELGKLPYISTCNSLFCKYYIDTVGIIPRWSKSHKLLKALHRKALGF